MGTALSAIYSQPALRCFMVNNGSCLAHHCDEHRERGAPAAVETDAREANGPRSHLLSSAPGSRSALEYILEEF